MPEQEIVTVNTFLEVREKKELIARRSTAPAEVLGEDLGSEDEQQGMGPLRTGRRAKTLARTQQEPLEENDGGFERSSEEEEEEESEEDVLGEPVHFDMKPLTSLQKIKTPDPWDMAKMIEAAEEEKSQNHAKKLLRRMDTPDHWERQAMMLESQIAVPAASSRVEQSPPQPASMPVAAVQMPLVLVTPVMAAPMAPASGQPTHVLGSGLGVGLCPPHPSPRLLGRTSEVQRALTPEALKRAPGSPGAVQREQKHQRAPLAPGGLECVQSPAGLQLVRWSVDGLRLDSNSEKLLSPEFQLNLPGQDPQPFRLMLLATQTGGKNGAGFKKAKGRGSLEIKCLGDLLAESGSLKLRLTVGSTYLKSSWTRTYCHNFADKSCCSLRPHCTGSEDWNLKAALDRDSQRVEITVEVLEHDA